MLLLIRPKSINLWVMTASPPTYSTSICHNSDAELELQKDLLIVTLEMFIEQIRWSASSLSVLFLFLLVRMLNKDRCQAWRDLILRQAWRIITVVDAINPSRFWAVWALTDAFGENFFIKLRSLPIQSGGTYALAVLEIGMAPVYWTTVFFLLKFSRFTWRSRSDKRWSI